MTKAQQARMISRVGSICVLVGAGLFAEHDKKVGVPVFCVVMILYVASMLMRARQWRGK